MRKLKPLGKDAVDQFPYRRMIGIEQCSDHTDQQDDGEEEKHNFPQIRHFQDLLSLSAPKEHAENYKKKNNQPCPALRDWPCQESNCAPDSHIPYLKAAPPQIKPRQTKYRDICSQYIAVTKTICIIISDIVILIKYGCQHTDSPQKQGKDHGSPLDCCKRRNQSARGFVFG